jgi:hypothetical protein
MFNLGSPPMDASLGVFAIFKYQMASLSTPLQRLILARFRFTRVSHAAVKFFPCPHTLHIAHRSFATLFTAFRVNMPTRLSSLVPWVNRDQLPSSLPT